MATKKNSNDIKKLSTDIGILVRPRITEKTARLVDNNAYTFEVPKSANKSEIKKAIVLLYGVTPVRVGTTKVSEKRKMVRGKVGIKKGGKKAIVYLKAGDKIQFS